MLAIGRALASSPRLLMLDEPSLGLSPIMADEMFEHIGKAHSVAGVTVLLVEQRVAESLESCDWAYVLDSGRITMQGQPQTLLRDERIRATYMGIAAVPPGFAGGPVRVDGGEHRFDTTQFNPRRRNRETNSQDSASARVRLRRWTRSCSRPAGAAEGSRDRRSSTA
jgi:ABC-type multidrug transport system ATPase subunit